MNPPSLQDRFSPNGVCFGCGPKNPVGLHIKSYIEADTGDVVAHWQPQPGHDGFPGMMNGGIISALLDCHSNWAAAWHLMRHKNRTEPECTVTGSFSIRFHQPTPMDRPVELRARLVSVTEKKAAISSTLFAKNGLCATFEGTFIVVPEDHPAYDQWGKSR